jgi:hypothetical protein
MTEKDRDGVMRFYKMLNLPDNYYSFKIWLDRADWKMDKGEAPI